MRKKRSRFVEKVNSNQRQIRRGNFWLLDEAPDLAVAVNFRNSKHARVSYFLQKDHRLGLRLPELFDKSLDALPDEVVSEIHQEGVAVQEVTSHHDGMGKAPGLFLKDKGKVKSPGILCQRLLYLRTGVRRNDDPHISDAHTGDLIHHVVNDRAVGHGNQLLGDRICQGPQAGSLSPCQNQGLHNIIPSPFNVLMNFSSDSFQ